MAPFLTEARKSELKGQNIYTVEALAVIEGAELKNLGPGGRDMKNQAIEYIEQGKAKRSEYPAASRVGRHARQDGGHGRGQCRTEDTSQLPVKRRFEAMDARPAAGVHHNQHRPRSNRLAQQAGA
mgnify:CR=1 FL=1